MQRYFSLTAREAEEHPQSQVRAYVWSKPISIRIRNKKLNAYKVLGVDVSPIQPIL